MILTIGSLKIMNSMFYQPKNLVAGSIDFTLKVEMNFTKLHDALENSFIHICNSISLIYYTIH